MSDSVRFDCFRFELALNTRLTQAPYTIPPTKNISRPELQIEFYTTFNMATLFLAFIFFLLGLIESANWNFRRILIFFFFKKLARRLLMTHLFWTKVLITGLYAVDHSCRPVVRKLKFLRVRKLILRLCAGFHSICHFERIV